VFDGGRIVEYGPHDELLQLLQKNGLCAELWNMRVMYYTIEI